MLYLKQVSRLSFWEIGSVLILCAGIQVQFQAILSSDNRVACVSNYNNCEFSRGSKKEYEAHIYDEIDSLLELRHVDDEYMLRRLEEMIAEIDAVMEE